LKRISAPVIVGINKIDRGTKYLEDYLRVWERIVGRPLSEVTQRVMPVPLSALAGTNVPCLLDEIFARLPQGPALYPDDVLTDFPRQLTIQDVIREKLFLHLRQELPFSLAVFVEEIKDTGDSLLTVRALIYVERPSQKGIVIGEKGSLLKTVGQESRLELQKIYGKKVFLELWVKVDPGWKQDHQLLQKMGYLTA
jgi:GTP-binding protein Era